MPRAGRRIVLQLLFVSLAAGACATLQDVLQPPTFSLADGRQAELRLLGPSSSRPLGGAAIRLWARVDNPNGFGLTLQSVAGNLFLDGTRAADVSFPLGVPLVASSDTIIPLDISLSFSDFSGLAQVAQSALTRNTIDYRLDGTFSVDAGLFGQPSFGPSTLLSGAMQVLR